MAQGKFGFFLVNRKFLPALRRGLPLRAGASITAMLICLVWGICGLGNDQTTTDNGKNE
jgi:hypothetical protein